MKVSVINNSNPNNRSNNQGKLDKTPSFKMEWNVRTFLDKEPISDPKKIIVIMQKLMDILTQPMDGDKKAIDININFRKRDRGLIYHGKKGEDIEFIELASQLLTGDDAKLHFLAATIEAAMKKSEDVAQLMKQYFSIVRTKGKSGQGSPDLFLVVNASSEKKTVAQDAEVVIDSIDFKSGSEIGSEKPFKQREPQQLKDEGKTEKLVVGLGEWPFANFARREIIPQLKLDLTS